MEKPFSLQLCTQIQIQIQFQSQIQFQIQIQIKSGNFERDQ